MRSVPLLSACALALLSLGAPLSAYGDDTHYHDYALGGRAVGLGGAFGAIASDPSGLFYNPAGIVNVNRNSVQISTNLYGLEISESFLSAFERIGDLNTVATELNVIPTTASFVSVVEEDRKGRPITAYGLGSFVPSYRSFNTSASPELAPEDQILGCRRLGYSRNLVDRTFMFGGSIAHRMNDVWRFGVSGFLAYRTLTDQESSSCSSGTEQGTAFANAQSNLRLAVAALILSLGVQADLGNGFTVGVNVTSPSIRAWDFADVSLQQTTASPLTGQSTFLFEEEKDLDANTKWGPSIRLAGAWVLPRRLTLSADVVFHLPTSYQLFELTDQNVLNALTTVTDVERRFVANFNVGAEWLVSDPFSISLGAFSNFSSAPPIEKNVATFQTDRLPHVNTFGGALVLGFFGGTFTLTRVGLTMSYGEGTDVVPDVAGLRAVGGRPEFTRADVSQLFLFFFASSTFRY